jgi:acyl-CoA thioesterase-2
MGDLAADTAVEKVGDGEYVATLLDDWEIWGPMGGYVATVALRAAGAESPFDRPASFFCHYLGVAAFEPVSLSVTTLRQARTACSQRVTMTQGDRSILEATVWSIGDVQGLSHHEAVFPDVPAPLAIPTMKERFPDDDAGPPFPFWNNLDSRQPAWHDTWPPTGPLPPTWQTWARFLPTATFADPWVDAGRAVILVDVQSWPSASGPHMWTNAPFIAPSLDLYVAFHASMSDSEWLLSDGYAPTAGDGLMGWTGKLWSEGRRLVASGGGQALCRRVAPQAV